VNVRAENPLLPVDLFCSGIFEAAPDGVLVSDERGQIVFANPQAANIFGYTVAELLQVSIDQLVPKALRSQHQNLRKLYFDDPHKRPMGIGLDLIAEKKDGQTVSVEISLSAFKVRDEPCVISIVRDVTTARELSRELQRNNLELKRSNEDLDQFAAIASHDLQEPLRMIGGYAQLLERRYQGQLDTAGLEYLEFILEGVKRLQQLIQDLLSYSRITSKPRPFGPVNLQEVISQVTANLQFLIAEKKAKLDLPPEGLPMVFGDQVQMTQLFQNLVANSLKFCNTTPHVTVAAHLDGHFWTFAVEDNGIGIPAEFRDKVFGIFQRLHTREAYPGTGVGLAICKRIIERHGGTIWITEGKANADNSALGVGTIFLFTLPAKL
jgi:PAS domain S-box-containing protein